MHAEKTFEHNEIVAAAMNCSMSGSLLHGDGGNKNVSDSHDSHPIETEKSTSM